MKREIYTEEHDIFRDAFRKFLEKEVVPHQDEWIKAGIVPREIWKKTGEQGFIAPWIPEEYGGAGADFLYSAVEIEEIARIAETGFALNLHGEIIVPYIAAFGNEEQKKKWLPGCASGDLITAVAMTEPDAGSDLQAIKTTAIKDGDSYVVNGQKTFISNGMLNDLCIVAAMTNPKAEPRYTGMSLIVVEDGTPGYQKVRKLDKLGMLSQDTAELFFEDCRVPKENLLGPEEGQGFIQLMQKLQQERLVCAIGSVASMWAVLDWTKQYCQERSAFGKPIIKFQNTRFKLVEMYTMAEICQTFCDRLVQEHVKGTDVVTETSMAKYFFTEECKKIVDQCLQFFGGYGYMDEYPISRAFRDIRVTTIYAGTTEIMKEIIGRNLGM
ncbi:MAG: acyl-CoA dehydrogenase family protein [Thermodesulfobacteriota bacterium]